MDNQTKEEVIKWFTAESGDGERTLKQHAFISSVRKRAWTHEEYPGNHALCNGRAGVMNENEEFVPIEEIESEPQKENCCAVCARLVRVSHPQA